MTGTFSGPLEGRPNPSSWATLLDLALPALDLAMPTEPAAIGRGERPRWTLGGGTALALQIGHRASDDIDIFLSGVRLAELSPSKNEAARRISSRFQWPGHYLKFERPEGEIDFLGSALQTLPGYGLQTFRGRQVALETPDEVMAKKLRYRATDFTERDAFDLACVLQARPEVAIVLAEEVADALPRARLVLERGDPAQFKARIRNPGRLFQGIFADILGRSLKALSAIEDVRDHPVAKNRLAEIDSIVGTIDTFEPGKASGKVRLNWLYLSDQQVEKMLARLDETPIHSKAAMLRDWQRRDPKAFDAWNDGGRAPPRRPVAGIDRSSGRDV